MKCPTCGAPQYVPAEPPVGTNVLDRHGGVSTHHEGGGWAPTGCVPGGVWERMWEARGPLVEVDFKYPRKKPDGSLVKSTDPKEDWS